MVTVKTQRQILIFSVLFVILAMCLHTHVFAAESTTPEGTGFPSVFDQFRDASVSISEKMISYGGKLLAMLALLQVAWNGADRMIKGNMEMKSVVGNMVRTSVVTIFFFVLIFKVPTWFLYAINQWVGIGSTVVGQGSIMPGDLMATGIDLMNVIGETLRQKAGSGISGFLNSVYISLQVSVIQILVLFAFFVLAGQLALAMIKGYLWMCIGPLLLGFGGMKTTRDVAVNTLKAVISHGAIIVTTYVIAGIAFLCVPVWNDMIMKMTLTDWSPIWGVVVSSGLIALSAWQVPKYANDFINGSVSGGISEVASAGITAAAGVAALATGGIAAAGAAAGAASGAGASLNGVMKAVGAGIDAAKDSGSTGMGAVAGGVMGAVSGGVSTAMSAGKDLGKSVLDKFQNASNESIGGKVADKIQSERGGSISTPGASPDVGTGDASKASLSGNSGGDSGGGGHKPSVADRIRGLNEHLPQSGDSNVSVGGGMGSGAADHD